MARATFHPAQEVRIRTFGVGLIALATLAVAGFLLTRRRVLVATAPGRRATAIDGLYAAGL